MTVDTVDTSKMSQEEFRDYVDNLDDRIGHMIYDTPFDWSDEEEEAHCERIRELSEQFSVLHKQYTEKYGPWE